MEEEKEFSLPVKALVLTLVSTALLGAAYVLGGPTALVGASLGWSVGIALAAVNHFFITRARVASGQGLVAMVMGGALVSVFVLGLTIILLGLLWRPVALPAGLTALTIYLTYKFLIVAEVTRELWRKSHKVPCPSRCSSRGREAERDE